MINETNEALRDELNLRLYNKMSREMEQYRNELLSMSPDEMLENSYGYATRQDILLAFEEYDLTAKQAAALLGSDNALDEIYSTWEQAELGYMDDIREMISASANARLREEFRREKREREAR